MLLGACIKTRLQSGEKVFINVCHSKEICAPEDISDDEFAKVMMEEVPGFVVPMAIGLEKMAKDKGFILTLIMYCLLKYQELIYIILLRRRNREANL